MNAKKLAKVTEKISASKELMKRIEESRFSSVSDFITTAERYIKAIKERRMICSIGSVSKSGMSRTIKFLAPEKYSDPSTRWQYLNFFLFFKQMGYTESRSREHYFTIGGCGMDMVFDTNYTIIHRLHRLGFISKKECDSLCQMTPTVI